MGTPADAVSSLWYVSHWPFVPVLTRLGLAVAIGLFIGLEREHRGKNGVRTFALTALGATGVNGIILSSLTSILINVPLIRSMTKETAFKRRVCLGLALVAVVGLVGVGLNEMISVFAPRFLTGS
jgi:hypothetical protein